MDRKLTLDGEITRLDGLVLQNNTWGRGELVAGRDYAQSIAHGDALSDGVRMDWSWPDDAPGIRAYPQLLAGRKPWGPDAGGDLLPLQVSGAEGLTARFDLAWGGETSGFNVAFDLWVTDRPDGGADSIRSEIMVWLKSGDFSPAGREAARVQILEQDAPLHVRTGHGGGWTYLAVVPPAETRAGELDLGSVVAQLAAQGHVSPDDWIISVELGAEVSHGEGWLLVREFALTRPGPAATDASATTAMTVAPGTPIGQGQPPALTVMDLAF